MSDQWKFALIFIAMLVAPAIFMAIFGDYDNGE